MGILLFLIFVLVPAAEIAVFIVVGQFIGVLPTVALIVLTAILGSALLRIQGLATLERVRRHLERGEMPVGPLFDGLCILVAGALLLTPGFVTDTLGVLLFLPPVRAALRDLLWRYLQRHGRVEIVRGGRSGGRSGPDGPTIEGEYVKVEDSERLERRPGENPDGKNPWAGRDGGDRP